MSAYEGFAWLYDLFMEVDYSAWADYVEALFDRFGIAPELVLDLACGTGGMTLELAERGYSMIGADLSEDMLAVAREKAQECGAEDVLFLCQDMRAFELYGTVGAIVCLCDSMNYLLSEEDLLQVLRLANNYLDPGGLFIFDMNTPYKFEHILADNTFAETAEGAAYIWENEYDAESCINAWNMTFFEEQEDGSYERFEELHQEKGYTQAQIEALIKKSGLKPEAVFDAYTFAPPTEESERLFFIAREITKTEEL